MASEVCLSFDGLTRRLAGDRPPQSPAVDAPGNGPDGGARPDSVHEVCSSLPPARCPVGCTRLLIREALAGGKGGKGSHHRCVHEGSRQAGHVRALEGFAWLEMAIQAF